MSLRGVTCEPNLYLPEPVTIARIKEEEKAKVAKSSTTGQIVERNARKEELQRTFSMNTNEYLKCRWNKFLENVPEKVLVIKPYAEYKRKKSPVRRMILTGAFYLQSGKLIPVPYKEDPRK